MARTKHQHFKGQDNAVFPDCVHTPENSFIYIIKKKEEGRLLCWCPCNLLLATLLYA